MHHLDTLVNEDRDLNNRLGQSIIIEASSSVSPTEQFLYQKTTGRYTSLKLSIILIDVDKEAIIFPEVH